MTDTLPHIRQALEASKIEFTVWDCDENLADTAAFCAHYGASLENSVNAILVKSKSDQPDYALCLVPALAKLDVNRTVRKMLGAKKASFASADETREITRMEIGGVTPLGLPASDDPAAAATRLPVWVEATVMELDYIILGGGNKTSKIKVSPSILRAVPHVEFVPNLIKNTVPEA